MDGDQVCTHFFTEGQWIISLSNFNEFPIADSYFICKEPSSVIIGNKEKAQELFKKFPRLETISRAVMETVFAEQQRTITTYLTETPEQRYLGSSLKDLTLFKEFRSIVSPAISE
jgi:hypothetical protein